MKFEHRFEEEASVVAVCRSAFFIDIRVFLLAFVFGVSALVSGCSSGPRRLTTGDTPPEYADPPERVPDLLAAEAPLLVKITYPSQIYPDALSVIESKYLQLRLGFGAPYGERTNSNALNSSLVAPKEFWGLPESGTRGKFASPLFEIRSGGAGALNRKVVAASEPIPISTTDEPSVLSSLLQRQAGVSPEHNRSKSLEDVYRSIVDLPWLEPKMSDLAWLRHTSKRLSERAVFGEAALAPVLQLIPRALRNGGWRPFYIEAENSYIKKFRREVVAAGGAVNESVDRPLLRRFIAAEVKLNVRLGSSAHSELFEGAWGTTMRASMEAEHQAIMKMAENIQRLAFAGGGGFAATIANVFATATQTAQMRESYTLAFEPVLMKAEEMRLEVGGSEQTLTATSIATR